ncbi:MAG TPA: serine/threonine-protein kinase, partial [Byssovorax sp.]
MFVARSDGFEGLFRLSALKRMKAQLCSDTALVSRFIEEARLAVRVEHEGTATVDDFGRVGGVYYIAFELVDGVTVEELIARTSARGIQIDPRACAYIARAAARALDAVHRTKGSDRKPLGLVHGDLQPKNILVGRDGRVKLRGFAAPSIFYETSALYDALGVVGVAHAAPEVLLGEQPTAKSDLFAMGVNLFELLTGGRLFPGSNLDDVVTAVRSVPIPVPSVRRPGLPSLLDAIVDEAVVRPPEQRPRDAKAWARALDNYLVGAKYDADAFKSTLTDLDDDDARGGSVGRQFTRVQRRPSTEAASSTSASAVKPEAHGKARPARVELPTEPVLVDQLRRDPGPWGLVRHGERIERDGRVDDARAIFRTAAVMFASRGLLAHALCAYDGARATTAQGDVAFDLKRLSELGAGDLALRQQELRRVGGLPYLEALRAQTDGVDAPQKRGTATPFL